VSDRICYLERTDRGLAIAGVRMVGMHADDHWGASSGGTPEAVIETIDDAAVWIRQRLKSGGGNPKTLPILCLDTDGAVCTWIKPEESSAEMISAAIDQMEMSHDDELSGGFHSSIGERFPNLPLEVNYESLDDTRTSDGSRKAVVATPDVPARLLIDQLDSLGTRIGRVENIWTLIARCWDPGAPHRSSVRDSQRVISEETPVSACVVVDPTRARLLWTWSKDGELLTAGSMRIGHDAEGVVLQGTDVSRLCADWIGWASQIGVAPQRVVVVLPDEEGGLDRSQIGSVFSKHWPGATTDLINEVDPLLKTLRTAMELADDTESSVGTVLTNRPGRSHRSMYRWAAAALIVASAAIGWTGWTLYSRGSDTQRQARTVRSAMNEKIMALQPPITDLRLPDQELQSRLNLLLAKTGPMQIAPIKPILQELETVSFVLGMSGIEIDNIQISHTLVKVKIRTENLSLAEQINEALRTIDGSSIQWRATPDLVKRGTQIEATFTGVWNTGSSS
jgi:hypothetical protein